MKALLMIWCWVAGHKPRNYVRTRGHFANVQDTGELPVLIHDTAECPRCGDYKTIRRVMIMPGENEPRFEVPPKRGRA